MEVMARSKYIRRTPRKARLVADTVRGMRVIDALA
jgi:ribosomal protein L22